MEILRRAANTGKHWEFSQPHDRNDQSEEVLRLNNYPSASVLSHERPHFKLLLNMIQIKVSLILAECPKFHIIK